MSRQPRTRGGPRPTAPGQPNPEAPAAAVEAPILPPNKRDIDAFSFPSATSHSATAAGPIEIGNANPMRLHVKGNLKAVVYNKDFEKSWSQKRMLESGKAGVGGKGFSVKAGSTLALEADKSTTTGAPATSVKAAVSAAKRPAQKRAREL